jgi:hypothetical protein
LRGGRSSSIEKACTQFSPNKETLAGCDLQVDTIVQKILGAVADDRILRDGNDVQILDIAANLNDVRESGFGCWGEGGVGFLGKGFTTENTEIRQRSKEVETRCSRLCLIGDANIASLRV